MRVWPVLRPTHAPATALRTNGNSAPPQNQKPKPLVLPLHRRLRLAGRSSGQHMPPQPPSKQTATAPPYKTKNLNPSCCRSTGGCGWLAGPPANTCSRNRPQNKSQQRSAPSMSFPSSEHVKESPKTKNPSCRHSVAACVSDHSRGQALAPATALKTNGNSAPPPPCRSQAPLGNASREAPLRIPAPATTLRINRNG